MGFFILGQWHLLKRIFAIFVTLLGYATLTQPTNREYWLYPVGRISVNGTYLKRIFAIFVTLLGYATLTQPTNREYWLYSVGRISVA